jgi:lipid II:glycine glycyltransferase (peptidoglycan interpeptide bridge formation enzyme)
VKVEMLTKRGQLIEWYRLVRKSYREARVPLADRSLFEAAFDILHPKGMVQFWLGCIDSNYVAASAELVYKDLIYGWYSGVDRAFAAEQPGEMLMWHVLAWGAQNGYKTYDFGGAGKPGEANGVRDFKAKFGGQLVSYGRNTLVHSPALLRFSERGYQFYRQLLG